MSENFETIEARLCAYVEGELDEQGQAEIEKHLEANPHHRRLLDELSAQRTLLRRLPRESAPSELAESFNGQLERAALLKGPEADSPDVSAGGAPVLRISRWPQYLAVAAVVLLAAGLGVMIYLAVPRGGHPDYAYVDSKSGRQASSPALGRTELAERGEPEGRATDLEAADAPRRGRANSDRDAYTGEGERMVRRSDAIMGKGGDAVLGKPATGVPDTAATQSVTESNVFAKETPPPPLNAAQLVETRLAENPNAMVVVVTSRDPRATTGQVAEFLTRNDIRWTDAAAAAAAEASPTLNLPNAAAQPVEPAPSQQSQEGRQAAPVPQEVAALKRQTGDIAGTAVAEQPAGRELRQEAARGPAMAPAPAPREPSQTPAKSAEPTTPSPAAETTAVAKAAQRPEGGSLQQQQQQANADQQLYDWAVRNQAANAGPTNNARPTGDNAIVARMTRQQAQALQLTLANQTGQRAQLYAQATAYRAALKQQQPQQLQPQQQTPTVQLQAQQEEMRQPQAAVATPPAPAPYGGRVGTGRDSSGVAALPTPTEMAKRDDVVRESARPEDETARRGMMREQESLPSVGSAFRRQQDVAARPSAPAATTQPAYGRAPAPARPLARGAESAEPQQVAQQPQSPRQGELFAGTNAQGQSRMPDVRMQMGRQQQQPTTRPAVVAGAPIQVGDELVVTLRGPSPATGVVAQQQPQTLRGRVAEDGTIQLPRLDAFACAGLTPAQAAQVIARKYQLADGATAVPAVSVERVTLNASANSGGANLSNGGAAAMAPDSLHARADAGGVAGAAPRSQADALRARGGGDSYGDYARNSDARSMTSAGAGGGQGRAAQDNEFGQQQQQDRNRSGGGSGGFGGQVGQAVAGGGAAAMGTGAAPATRPANLTAGQPVVAQQQQQSAPAPEFAGAAPQTQEAAGAAPADQPVDVLILVKDEEAENNAGAADAAPGATDRTAGEAVAPPPQFPTTRPAAAR